MGLMVTVGKRVSPLPPRRSRRALLTHRAPPLGFGVEAVAGQGVAYPDWWKETIDKTAERFPVDVSALAAATEGPPPEVANAGAEPGYATGVQRDGIVVQVPSEHLVEPRSRLRDGVVPSSAQRHLDRL
jgi:hypothetical protein